MVRGIIGFNNNINFYGKDIALLFQMDIIYSDGTKEQILWTPHEITWTYPVFGDLQRGNL
jgi:alpha-L-rhamnosidase